MAKEKSFIYKLLKFLLSWLFKLFFRPIIINKGYIPDEGGIIIACNHKGVLDPCMMAISTKRVIHFLAKDKHYDKWFLKPLFKAVGCIKVNTKFKDGLAMKEGIKVLNNQQVVGIYPEGTRNKTEEILLPFKYGTVKMARETKAYIVPCALIGDFKFRSRIKIVFDKPYRVRTDNLEFENKRLYKKIKKLMEDNK